MKKKSVLLLINNSSLERAVSLLLKQAEYQVTSEYNLGQIQIFDAVISYMEKSLDDRKDISLLLKKFRPIPVVAIIPYGSEQDDAVMLKNNGCSTVLHSPFEPEELFGCLEQLFRQAPENTIHKRTMDNR